MKKEFIEIGAMRIDLADISAVWVDQKSTGLKSETSSEDHYIGSAFSLLIAGLVSAYLKRREDRKNAGKNIYILNVVVNNGTTYRFDSKGIDIPEILKNLALKSRLALSAR
ncbi:hypothetical protein [Jeongeupia sp. USM3]|uniref:hypothetical protein n=1 Tax=Jeongeupia sp. USM3 TaxID=1906741 RepID=UPI00089DECEA|nr:hypothetical protein [Jeongeupia sp. USM3]AOY01417.1 hypothetical protein BJP62_13740 [Jeongeupia sp. USM3]